MHLKPLQKEKKKKTAEATTELIGLVIQLQTWYLPRQTLSKGSPRKLKTYMETELQMKYQQKYIYTYHLKKT